MRRTIVFWTSAFVLTAASAVYQRVTGPTYPYSGKAVLGGKTIAYKFERSHTGSSGHAVKVRTDEPAVTGLLLWRYYQSGDKFRQDTMRYKDGQLSAEMPNQPPAGKLEYRVILETSGERVYLPGDRSIIIRFRGDVPAIVLYLHIFAMFIGMLISTRAGIEAAAGGPDAGRFVYRIIGFLLVGGLILGPLVQWYAFGQFWTGWPAGRDLTDNKTALILILWSVTAFVMKRSKNPRWWILTSALITLAVYLIPHSVLGSELTYSGTQKQGAAMLIGLLFPFVRKTIIFNE